MIRKNKINHFLAIGLIPMLAIAALSCSSDIYDNVEEFGKSEEIYAGKFDGVQKIQYGFERVEIDLMKVGRVPASHLYLGRATKTVISCDDFDEPNHERIIDSLCSWVNVTGLTQSKTYQLKICTEDENGNRSLPISVSVTPFTSKNLESLSITNPSILESDGFAKVEWRAGVSNETYEALSYSYSYTDKDGQTESGKGDGDQPSFFVENIEAETETAVNVTFLIRPTVSIVSGGSTQYIPILDTVEWTTPITVKISADATPYIFLINPESGFSVDIHNIPDKFPYTFSWVKINSCKDYILKFSNNNSFPAESTYTIDVGDTKEYTMSAEEAETIFNSFGRKRELPLYWTVVPADEAMTIETQIRDMSILCPPTLIGEWLFNDPSNLCKANVGKDLIPVNGTLSVAEESGNDYNGVIPEGSAAEVPASVMLKCMHQLPDRESLSLMMWIKTPNMGKDNFLTETDNPDNPAGPELRIGGSKLCLPGYAPSNDYKIGNETWHQIFYVADGDVYYIYVDGMLQQKITTDSDRFKFRSDAVSFFGGPSSNQSIKVAAIRLWDMPMSVEEIYNAMDLNMVPKSEMSVAKYLETISPAIGNPQNVINGMITDGAPWVGRYPSDPSITNWDSSHKYLYQYDQETYLVLDMGKTRNVKEVSFTIRGWGGSNLKTVKFFVGNSYNYTSMMTEAVTFERSSCPMNDTGVWYSAWLPEAISGRYVMVDVTEMYNHNFNIGEVTIIEEL